MHGDKPCPALQRQHEVPAQTDYRQPPDNTLKVNMTSTCAEPESKVAASRRQGRSCQLQQSSIPSRDTENQQKRPGFSTGDTDMLGC